MSKILLSLSAFSSFGTCFSSSLSSNFILVSSQKKSYFVEHKNTKRGVYGADGVFSYYSNVSAISPETVTKKENKIFLMTNKNKLEHLGFFLPPENRELVTMEAKVCEGKLLLGFRNKSNKPVAFVQDKKGAVYSVTRLSKQHYSIEALGILAENI